VEISENKVGYGCPPLLTVIIPTGHRKEDNPIAIFQSVDSFPGLKKYLEFFVIGHKTDLSLQKTFSSNYLLSGHQDPGCKRNLGIKLSKGKYFTFVDADDSIELSGFTDLVELLLTDEPDLIIANFETKDGIKSIYSSQLPDGRDSVKKWDASNLWSELGSKAFNSSIAPGVLASYRLTVKTAFSTAQNLEFPCSFLGEDQVFGQRTLAAVNSITFLPSITYSYKPRPSGLAQMKSKSAGRDLARCLNILNFEAQSVPNLFLRQLLINSSKYFEYRMLAACISPRHVLSIGISKRKAAKLTLKLFSNWVLGQYYKRYGSASRILKIFIKAYRDIF